MPRVPVIVPDILLEALAPRIAEAMPGAEAIAIDANGTLASDATGAVAMLRYFPNDRFAHVFKGDRIDELIDAYPTLRLIQSHGAGVDGLLTPRLIASNAVLCNAAPLAGTSSGEILVSRIERSVVEVESSNCPLPITQRTRC